VTHLRREARRRAARDGRQWVLVDGPPGIGCPAHAAITGVDGVVVVTEPTEAGAHDLTRALDLAHHFGVSAGVVLNKCDLSAEGARRVETVASRWKVPLLGSIPFDPRLPRSLGRRETGLELGGVRESIVACWTAVGDVLVGRSPVEEHLVALGAN
jgi:MinD superfamily P-loop ATPase